MLALDLEADLRRREFIMLIGTTAALSALPRAAAALDYPTRPVHWIVGFPPGGATDIIARLMGQWLSERLGQSFVIDNRPGAGSNIGTEAVAHAPADGYTLLLISAAQPINATLYEHQFCPRYRPSREHQPRAQPDGGAPLGSGDDRSRVHRLRHGQSGQGHHGVVRQRHHRPCQR
jgi:hypothetical protein